MDCHHPHHNHWTPALTPQQQSGIHEEKHTSSIGGCICTERSPSQGPAGVCSSFACVLRWYCYKPPTPCLHSPSSKYVHTSEHGHLARISQLSQVLKCFRPPSAALYTAQRDRCNQPHLFACQHGSAIRDILWLSTCAVPLNLASIECLHYLSRLSGVMGASMARPASRVKEKKTAGRHGSASPSARWKGTQTSVRADHCVEQGPQVLIDGRTVIAQQWLF
jgi:hypothetical protein